MGRYSKDYAPTASDFEESIRKTVERHETKERIRGPSNEAGDDGLYRDKSSGALEVIECKYVREDSSVPKKHITSLANAIDKTKELYTNAPSVGGTLYTTAGNLSLPAKKALKEVRKAGIEINVMCHSDLKSMAQILPVDDEERFALEKALATKARRFKG